jgi:hypothetical protein
MHSKGYGYHESTFFRNGTNCSIRFSDEKLDGVEYSKNDIWVLFNDQIQPVFAISDSFGVVQRNRIDLVPFFDKRLNELPMQMRATAIRLFNMQGERSEILRLYELGHCQIPILPSLLSGTPQEAVLFETVDSDVVLQIAGEVANDVDLNENQRDALLHVADFFKPNSMPILLIHGIFGAGKSKLLSIIAIFLHIVLTRFGLDDRILIVASTNVAVDNILSDLRDFEVSLPEEFGRQHVAPLICYVERP